MNNRVIFVLSALGVVCGMAGAYLFGQVPQPPLFSPAQNPFSAGIYTNGIVESDSRTARTSISIRKCPERCAG